MIQDTVHLIFEPVTSFRRRTQSRRRISRRSEHDSFTFDVDFPPLCRVWPSYIEAELLAYKPWFTRKMHQSLKKWSKNVISWKNLIKKTRLSVHQLSWILTFLCFRSCRHCNWYYEYWFTEPDDVSALQTSEKMNRVRSISCMEQWLNLMSGGLKTMFASPSGKQI